MVLPTVNPQWGLIQCSVLCRSTTHLSEPFGFKICPPPIGIKCKFRRFSKLLLNVICDFFQKYLTLFFPFGFVIFQYPNFLYWFPTTRLPAPPTSDLRSPEGPGPIQTPPPSPRQRDASRWPSVHILDSRLLHR